MTANARTQGAWSPSDLRVRDGGAWTDAASPGYVRDDGSFVQFQPNATQLDFPPPTNLAVVADSTAATLSWTDQAPGDTPTHVQIRVPEITPVWTEYAYGTTTFGVAQLLPATEYQFQARYIIRSTEDGSVSRTSSTATKFFTTAPAAAPSLPAPGPPPPSGANTNSTISFPSTPGGPSCTWTYTLQENTGWVAFNAQWADTAITGTGVSSAADIDIDLVAEGIACNTYVRWRFNEVCDGTPGDETFSDGFYVVCDWGQRCGDQAVGAAWTTPPYTDAISQVPQLCLEPFTYNIEDYATAEVFGKLSAFQAITLNSDGDWELRSNATAGNGGDPLTAGRCTSLFSVNTTKDLTFSMRIELNTQPRTDLEGGTKLAVIGGILTIRAYALGAGYRIGAVMPRSGATIDLQGTTEIALGDTVDIWVVIDGNGTKELYVNFAVDVSDPDTSEPDYSAFSNDIEIYSNANALISRITTWDQVVTPAAEFAVRSVGTPTYRASGDASNTITVPIPAVANGSYLVVHLAGSNLTSGVDPAVAAPTGWTLLDDIEVQGLAQRHSYVFGKPKEASDGATVDFVAAGGNIVMIGNVYAYGGISGISPVDNKASLSSSAANIGSPALTSTTVPVVLLGFFAQHTSSPVTIPTLGDFNSLDYIGNSGVTPFFHLGAISGEATVQATGNADGAVSNGSGSASSWQTFTINPG